MTEKKEQIIEHKGKYIYAKGGRKTSSAQCRLYLKGEGLFTVNSLPLNKYFTTLKDRTSFLSPLEAVGRKDNVNLSLKVIGGGKASQADACRHAVASALVKSDEELRPTLRALGFLTRDPRVKERKKPGLKRARRAPQWSKR